MSSVQPYDSHTVISSSYIGVYYEYDSQGKMIARLSTGGCFGILLLFYVVQKQILIVKKNWLTAVTYIDIMRLTGVIRMEGEYE